MKRTISRFNLKTLSSCLIFAILLSGHVVYAQNKAVLKLKANPEIEYQTIDGFGASDAWSAQFLGKNWPVEKRTKAADLLFSKEFDSSGNAKGIGLSIWRFNLTSGATEQGDSSNIGNPWRRGDCFLNSDGSYNWNKQEGQRWFLEAAKARGVEKFLAFPNSPPVYYTKNGKGFAPNGEIHLNLKPGFMDDYSKYMVDVIEHFNREGIFFDYVSPVNEPQWNWDNGGQEGTPALNEEIYNLVRYLSHYLSSHGLKTKIVIGEAGSIGHACMTMNIMGLKSDGRDNQSQFFFSKDSPFYIADLPNVEKTISAHSYQSVWPIDKQIEYRMMLNSKIKQANPDLGYWMSEYCILEDNDEIGGGGGRDLTMKTALYVARIIHNDLTLANAKSWQWWTAISAVDFKDGLLYLVNSPKGDAGKTGNVAENLQNDGELKDSKLLWVLGNYSRFIRPGMVRIQTALSEEQSSINGLLVSAYKDPKNTTLVYVLTNLSDKEMQLDLGPKKKVKSYTTDKSHDLGFTMQDLNKVIVPARSVVTVLN